MDQDNYKKLIEEGKIKQGDKINNPTSPLFDPTRPPTFFGEEKIIQRDPQTETVIMTRMDKMPENIEENEAAE